MDHMVRAGGHEDVVKLESEFQCHATAVAGGSTSLSVAQPTAKLKSAANTNSTPPKAPPEVKTNGLGRLSAKNQLSSSETNRHLSPRHIEQERNLPVGSLDSRAQSGVSNL